MVSTLTILFISGLSLLLVWRMLRPGLPQIHSLGDWEAKKHQVDVAAFRMLLDPAEEEELRTLLPAAEYRLFQKRRLGLALRAQDLIGQNAAMLMKLGQLAKIGGSPALISEADALISGALRLRVNLMLIEPYLRLKWLFPGWTLSVPELAMPYEEMLSYLNRIRQQQRWGLYHNLEPARF